MKQACLRRCWSSLRGSAHTDAHDGWRTSGVHGALLAMLRCGGMPEASQPEVRTLAHTALQVATHLRHGAQVTAAAAHAAATSACLQAAPWCAAIARSSTVPLRLVYKLPSGAAAMCIERWVQRFFSPFAPSWTAPVPPSSLDALDAAVLRRLRYLAACPLLVAAWSLAALVLGGVTAQRLGTLGAGVMQTAVLCATCAPGSTCAFLFVMHLLSLHCSRSRSGARRWPHAGWRAALDQLHDAVPRSRAVRAPSDHVHHKHPMRRTAHENVRRLSAARKHKHALRAPPLGFVLHLADGWRHGACSQTACFVRNGA